MSPARLKHGRQNPKLKDETSRARHERQKSGKKRSATGLRAEKAPRVRRPAASLSVLQSFLADLPGFSNVFSLFVLTKE
jgi:hypothetical protein